MKTIIFIGNDSNQIALAAAVAKITEVNSLVIRSSTQPTFTRTLKSQLLDKLKRIIKYTRKSFIFPLNRAWFKMLNEFEPRNVRDISKEIIYVSSINDPQVFKLIDNQRPELVIVSGTNLLSKRLINQIRKHGEILNLHTGLSPFVNGGPNCTNWCLYLKAFELIGNTVMFIDEGIDTGDIISTESIDISEMKNLTELHKNVMERAHSLYLRVISRYLDGKELPRTSQKTIRGEKRILFTKNWTIGKELKATYNFYMFKFVGKKLRENETSSFETFSLDREAF
jgi:folate-dependent phosphoribosylglycinamide formyltransferase PurN